MEILETSKLKQEALVRLDSSEMTKIRNALYRYLKEEPNDEIASRLYARMILAGDMTQYGLIDGFSMDMIKEAISPKRVCGMCINFHKVDNNGFCAANTDKVRSEKCKDAEKCRLYKGKE